MIVLWLAAGLLASPATIAPVEKQGGGSSAYLTAVRHDPELRKVIVEEYERAENALREPVDVESAELAPPTPAPKASKPPAEFEPAPAPINTAMRDAIIAAGIDAQKMAIQLRKRQDDEAIALILCMVDQ